MNLSTLIKGDDYSTIKTNNQSQDSLPDLPKK